MKNKLVLTGLAVLAVLFALSYLGSTKVYTVTYTVKGSDPLTEEQRQARLKSDNDIIRKTNDEERGWGVNVQLPPETSLPSKAPETAELTMQNASGGSQQMTVDLPWTMTMQKHSGDFLYLSAQGGKGTFWVDVEIRSDGNLVQEAHSGGEYSIATASGKVQ